MPALPIAALLYASEDFPSNVVFDGLYLQHARRFGAACSEIGTAHLEIALLGLCSERQLIRLWHRGYRRQIESPSKSKSDHLFH
ncbi:hypothetical protein BQ8794_100077 [Mesorhizobium prunaredense]|uniref:Uncharacterized protein n=1 Tax=Mesorhizobium prunaredense TaxID=1631249 RepID=A0A1R3V1U0_9HYPH|nr:hypothetical protein BQ8794_100077 [Mesorhizobium prunaredense]